MVSVIICFYERVSHLRCCLDSLRFSRQDFDEVVIVDDGSSAEIVEEAREITAAHEFPIRYVWQEHRGFRAAAARNEGIRNATGDYLIFFDCDFLILPGTVRAHVAHAKPGRFVAGSCKYLSETQSERVHQTVVSKALMDELYSEIPDRELRIQHRRYNRRTFLMRLGLVSHRKQGLGGHLSIFKNDIEIVNGYDENFIGWGGEDEDLGIRLVKAGIYCRSAIPHARVMHIWHPKAIGDKHWESGPNIAYFNRRNRPYFCENGLVRADGIPETSSKHAE
ncbi:hypothetical protein D3OALGA1CA_497 [Olavius algarvensis associated proteobacterium Delta 3]|nr:hypothetical protein D3OALGB2SA_441 [Olavius algarvensis associated proteobacterium Delta 3]CAB5084833.1 hypothetical protein D3OALGA1CA_497 [Olavius algarvensis associated proteobacterium Delta 3]